ncbi:hypothetical protein GCK72_011132 [Caenorhabditis remanei]|uniref:Tyrosine-protein phosphatase domain-containing protein n=1 Tax=Caenorhabditis remanei TaxID=31234 RepID=A0A6A5H735_CAERE|nr:hypothetical protein GCK72_011132 [Caenorhabditis remanei]KAF1762869.1 hypothetical protein GCK72_011132 [Caenorhabditis remanei]
MASARRAKLLIFLACSILTAASNGVKQSADIGNANYPPSSDDLHNDPHKMDPLYIPRGTYEVTNNDPHHRTDSEPHPSDIESDRSRFRRDSNEHFTTMVDRMEKISRVVNGISIQQGIINGTLKPDALISEFLNFGGLTISEIEAINVDEVTKVVEEMQQLSKKLAKDDGIARIETRFLLYESMLEKTKGIGKNITIPEFNQYSEAVKELMNTTPDQGFLDTMQDFGAFVTVMDSLDRDDKKDKSVTSNQLTLCASSYSNVVNMDKYKTSLLKNEILRNKSTFDPIDKANQAILEFQNDLGVSNFKLKDKELMILVGNNIGNLTTLAAKAKSSLSVLENLRLPFVTRHHIRGNRQLTQTPGYQNGITDFGLIFSDLKDSWVQQAVDGQSDALAKALDNLRDLKRDLQTSDGSFHLDSAEETNLMTTKAEMIELSEYARLFDEFTKSVRNISVKFGVTDMEPSNGLEFQKLMGNILLLSDHLRALEVVVDVSGKLVADEGGDIKKFLEIIKNPKSNTAFTLLDNLRKSEEFKKVMKLVRTAEASIGVLVKKDESGNDPKSVIETAKAVHGSSSQMQPYLDGLDKLLSNMDTLRNVPGIDQMGKAIRTIQYYRNHTFKSSSFEKISNKVNNAKNSLTKLQKSLADIKGDVTPESTALVELRDLFTDSQNIGGATRVFRSMQMAKDKKLVVVTPAMADVVKKLKNVSPKQQEQLNQLMGLDKELTTLIAAIGKIETSVTPSTSTDLISLWPIFSLANGAKGIPMDFLETSETIEMLSKDPSLKSHQQDLLKIKNDLDTLDSLGLDYSKHQSAIKGTAESLKQLDLFFASYERKVTSAVVSVSAPPSAQNSISGSGGINAETEEPDWNKPIVFIPIILVGLFCIGGIVGAIIYWILKNRVFKIVIEDRVYEIYLADIICRMLCFIKHYKQENEKMLYSTGFKLYFLALFEHTCKPTDGEEHYDHVTMTHALLQGSKQPLSKNERLQIRKNKKLFREDQYIHANQIKYRNNFKLALFQPPQLGSQENNVVPETVGTFYWAMKTCKANLVVCMAKIGSDCFQYFPVKVGDSLTFANENLVVTCKSYKEICRNKIRIRTLEIKFEGYSAFTITHAHYDEWTSNFFPTDYLSPIVSILMKMDKEKKMVFMHCDSGLHRSGILAQVIMNKSQLGPDNGYLDYGSSVNKVRKSCSGVIKNGTEFLNMAAITFKFIRASVQKSSPDKKFSETTETHIKIIETCILNISENAKIQLNVEKLHEMMNGKKDVAKGSKVAGNTKNEDANKEAKANLSKGQSTSAIPGIKFVNNRPVKDKNLDTALNETLKVIDDAVEQLKSNKSKPNVNEPDKEKPVVHVPEEHPSLVVNEPIDDNKDVKEVDEKGTKTAEEKETKTVDDKGMNTAEEKPMKTVDEKEMKKAKPEVKAQKEKGYKKCQHHDLLYGCWEERKQAYETMEDEESDWGSIKTKKKAK